MKTLVGGLIKQSSYFVFYAPFPISVRRCGVGGARGYESVQRFVTFFSDGFPRVAKCHGYDGYICVKILVGQGKSL